MSVADEKKMETEFSLVELLGSKAVTPTGETISIGTDWVSSKKDRIALYFSAHWCPPCRQFTPLLAKAYKEFRDGASNDDQFEQVFVSWDDKEEDFLEYHGKEMTFPALDHKESRPLIEKLNAKYKVKSIPTIVVIDAKTGERLDDFDIDHVAAKNKTWTMSPRQLIEGYGSAAFPLSAESCQRCAAMSKAKQEEALKQLLKLPNAILPPNDDDNDAAKSTTTFGELLDAYQYVSILLGPANPKDLGTEYSTDYPQLMKDANSEGVDGKKKLAILVVPAFVKDEDDDSDTDDEEEKKQGEEDGDGQSKDNDAAKNLFRFQEAPMAEIINLFLATAGKTLRKFDTLVTVQQSSREVEECGLNGACSKRVVKDIEVISMDEFVWEATYHGAKFCPWSPPLLEQAKTEEKARAAVVKEKIGASLQTFLLEQAAAGNIVMGKNEASVETVQERLNGLDDEEGTIAVYLAAAQGFTPKLLECLDNIPPAEAGKKRFEVLFVPHSGYYHQEVPEKFLAMKPNDNKETLRAMFAAFDMDYFCCTQVFLLKKGGSRVAVKGGAADAIKTTGAWGFPWDAEGLAKGKAKMVELLKAEDERVEKYQEDQGVPVIRRMIGTPINTKHVPEESTIQVEDDNAFFTYGLEDTLITADTMSNHSNEDLGVFYYEVEIVKAASWSVGQFGFCIPGALDKIVEEQRRGVGNGDVKDSWGVCGFRGLLWTNGGSTPHEGAKWKEGDVVGLAVNVKVGKIAVTVNGGKAEVVFHDEAISSPKGVFPCLTIGDDLHVKINTTRETFAHDGPSPDVWLE